MHKIRGLVEHHYKWSEYNEVAAKRIYIRQLTDKDHFTCLRFDEDMVNPAGRFCNEIIAKGLVMVFYKTRKALPFCQETRNYFTTVTPAMICGISVMILHAIKEKENPGIVVKFEGEIDEGKWSVRHNQAALNRKF